MNKLSLSSFCVAAVGVLYLACRVVDAVGVVLRSSVYYGAHEEAVAR